MQLLLLRTHRAIAAALRNRRHTAAATHSMPSCSCPSQAASRSCCFLVLNNLRGPVRHNSQASHVSGSSSSSAIQQHAPSRCCCLLILIKLRGSVQCSSQASHASSSSAPAAAARGLWGLHAWPHRLVGIPAHAATAAALIILILIVIRVALGPAGCCSTQN
jgi:hypothetical protein